MQAPGTLKCLEGPSQAEPQQHSSHALGVSHTPASSGPSHSRDHPYYDPEEPEAKVKRLSGHLTTTRKQMKCLRERAKRYHEKNKALECLIEDLKNKHLISDEAEQKLQLFGNVPQEILISWSQNAMQVPRGRRYSEEMKKFATTLHYYSPRAYEYMSKMFPMPSTRVIRAWLKAVDGWPGFTAEVLDDLRRKHKDDTPRERLCSILLDGMSIKRSCNFDSSTGRFIGYVDLGHSQEPQDDLPLATDALVFMVVGLAAPWKMPFSFFLNAGLSGEVLKNLVLEAIACIQDCGLTVVAVVCDCLGANVAMAKLLGCQVHEHAYGDLKPCFPNPRNKEEKIFMVFDACHGLKLLRNLLGDKGTLLSSAYGVSSAFEKHKCIVNGQSVLTHSQKRHCNVYRKLASHLQQQRERKWRHFRHT